MRRPHVGGLGRMLVAFLSAVSPGCPHGERLMGFQTPRWTASGPTEPPGPGGILGLRTLARSFPGEAEKGLRGCAQLCVTPDFLVTWEGQGPSWDLPCNPAKECTGPQPDPKWLQTQQHFCHSLSTSLASAPGSVVFWGEQGRGGGPFLG